MKFYEELVDVVCQAYLSGSSEKRALEIAEELIKAHGVQN